MSGVGRVYRCVAAVYLGTASAHALRGRWGWFVANALLVLAFAYLAQQRERRAYLERPK